MANSANKKGRKRRPGTIDQLPEEFKQLIGRLLAEGWTKTAITCALNRELKKTGRDAVSRYSVNRYTARMLAQGQKIREAREAAAAWSRSIGPIKDSDLGAYLIEMVRLLAMEHVHLFADHCKDEGEDTGPPQIEAVTKLALAIQRLEAAHQQTDRRIEAAKKRVAEEAGKAVKDAGLSDETVNAVRQRILGVAT